MTDLESPKKNNDCYFYYYSTCSKGDSCGFRHEPSALGCETICSFWKEGKCLNIHCNFRHMELRKNRKAIPCYWESQPGGCLKPHCPFLHQNAQSLTGDNSKLSKPENALPENCTQAGNFKSTSSVDSLVVNFEEESDNESTPSASPVKSGVPKVKTLEEIKLEKMAAACAAYYSYPDNTDKKREETPSDDLRQRIMERVKSRGTTSQAGTTRKFSPDELAFILGDSSLNRSQSSDADHLNIYPPYKKRKTSEPESTQQFKIKTLDEIRAERNIGKEIGSELSKRRKHSPIRLSHNTIKPEERKRQMEEAEVSSTSNDEPEPPNSSTKASLEENPFRPFRKLDLKKIKSFVSKESERINVGQSCERMEPEPTTVLNNEKTKESNSEGVESSSKQSTEDILFEDKNERELQRSLSNKTVDESLLLLDDEMQDSSINLKSEDDLLNEIDSLLDD